MGKNPLGKMSLKVRLPCNAARRLLPLGRRGIAAPFSITYNIQSFLSRAYL